MTILRNILTFIGYTGYVLSGLIFLLSLLPLSLIIAPFPKVRLFLLSNINRYFCAFLTKVYLPNLGIYSIKEISGFIKNSSKTPTVYVANHRGRLDSLLLLGILKNTGVIIKEKYAKLPLYSSFVKHMDFISVNPSSLSSMANTINKCKNLISRGKNILIFPEGTRAKTGKLLPFKDLGFRIAINANVSVTPIIIHSTLPFMAKIKGSHFPNKKFSYKIRCLPPIKPNLNERPGEFAERVRHIMAKSIKKLDEKTVWQRNN